MIDDRDIFLTERQRRVKSYQNDSALLDASKQFMSETLRTKYSYQFDWLGLPIIQYPQDIVIMQELIWSVRPDLIIETGIARGGSLIFSASMLALLDLSENIADHRATLHPRRKVIGVDIDIRPHNRCAIEKSPFVSYVEMIEGSSIDFDIIEQVRLLAKDYHRPMVLLDSNHTHDHVLAELEAYAPLVGVGSYCIVFDTLIEDYASATFADRPWYSGNSPKSAVNEFLKINSNFQIDHFVQDKLLVTAAKDGFLKRLK
jgi:cephalosporin hydroxylase